MFVNVLPLGAIKQKSAAESVLIKIYLYSAIKTSDALDILNKKDA